MQKAFDLSEWATKNLDQEVVSKNVKDMEAFQMELQDRFINNNGDMTRDRLAVFRSIEGHKFFVYLSRVHMTANKFLDHTARSSDTDPATVEITLPFYSWQLAIGTGFWRSHSIFTSLHHDTHFNADSVGIPSTFTGTFYEHEPLMRIAQMVNFAYYAQDSTLLSAMHDTMRNRLINHEYASGQEILDAIKFVWTDRPFSFALNARYSKMRKILLTHLLRVRKAVLTGQRKYFEEIVSETGGKNGAFCKAYDLGVAWCEMTGLEDEDLEIKKLTPK